MTTQIVTSPTDAPVTSDDVIIVGTTGSISSNDAGTALTLSDTFSAYIDGDIYAINAFAIETESATSTSSLVIGESGHVVAKAESTSSDFPEDTVTGLFLDAPIATLENRGVLEGDQSGINIIYSASELTESLTIDNIGSLYGGTAIEINADSTFIINNEAGALIDGTTYAIATNNPAATVTVNNDGTVYGEIDIPSTSSLDAASSSGTVIRNTGLIDSEGAEFAITLGKGDDFVRNQGTIEGAVHLKSGDDTYRGGETADVVFGGSGRDDIKTHAGDDIITAGRGRDTIKTGGGEDTIIHAIGDGRDQVIGFKPGKDQIDLSSHAFDDFDDLSESIRETDDGLAIDLTGQDRLRLDDLSLSDLSESDFII